MSKDADLVRMGADKGYRAGYDFAMMEVAAKNGWHPIDTAPRDPNIEIMLFYHEWCGTVNFIVSGHWHSQEGREYEATWEHSCGYGDADMWQPLPQPPRA